MVRPMAEGDVAAAEAAWDDAYTSMRSAHGLPQEPRTEESIARGRRRVAHLLAGDPGGSWVAEDDGRLVGMAQAHVRGQRWVLANLGVRPSHQDRRVGRELLAQTLRHGEGAPGGAIFSSPDVRAVHRYVAAGFDLHPAVSADGSVRNPPVEAPEVQEAGAAALDLVDEVDRTVRRSTRRRDIEFQLEAGCRLLLHPDGGYALVRQGRLAALAAADEAVAGRLLQAHLARSAPGQVVSVSWLRPRDQWAVTDLAAAGVSLRVHGAVMLRGQWEMEGPYLPSGVFG